MQNASLEPRKLKGGHDPKELGRRGGLAKERNALARINETREAILARAPELVDRLTDVALTGRDADATRAALGLLDRGGVGPHSSQDVQVGISLIQQWAKELDIITVENEATSEDVEEETKSNLTHETLTPPHTRALTHEDTQDQPEPNVT